MGSWGQKHIQRATKDGTNGKPPLQHTRILHHGVGAYCATCCRTDAPERTMCAVLRVCLCEQVNHPSVIRPKINSRTKFAPHHAGRLAEKAQGPKFLERGGRRLPNPPRASRPRYNAAHPCVQTNSRDHPQQAPPSRYHGRGAIRALARPHIHDDKCLSGLTLEGLHPTSASSRRCTARTSNRF